MYIFDHVQGDIVIFNQPNCLLLRQRIVVGTQFSQDSYKRKIYMGDSPYFSQMRVTLCHGFERNFFKR